MKNYTIREISEMFGLPSSTLRYYESEGLLPEVPKSSSRQRIYSDEHVERLKCINCFKRTGMTIPQLRKFFIYEADEAAHIDKIISLLKDQEQIVNEKHIELYDKTLSVLDFLLTEFAHDIKYAEFEYLDIPKNTLATMDFIISSITKIQKGQRLALGLDNEMAENEEPQINIIEGLSEEKI